MPPQTARKRVRGGSESGSALIGLGLDYRVRVLLVEHYYPDLGSKLLIVVIGAGPCLHYQNEQSGVRSGSPHAVTQHSVTHKHIQPCGNSTYEKPAEHVYTHSRHDLMAKTIIRSTKHSRLKNPSIGRNY